MNILHASIEIAGQMGILCDALRRYGHHAVGYNHFHTYLGYERHIINTDEYEIARISGDAMEFFDMFHFHHAATLLAQYKDLELLMKIGKPAVMHHWGSDVRTDEDARKRNPHTYTGNSPSSDKIDRLLTQLGEVLPVAIVQDHEVLPYVERYYSHVEVLPLAIPIHQFTPHYPAVDGANPLVIHAPTNPNFKGTFYIEHAIQKLQKEYHFNYIRIEQMSNVQAIELYKAADIIIDQILCGSYGLLSVEAMALGKPVIAYLTKEVREGLPSVPPIQSANPDTIYDVLKGLLRSGAVRRSLGEKGRQFAEHIHDSHKVARQLLQIYKNLKERLG